MSIVVGKTLVDVIIVNQQAGGPAEIWLVHAADDGTLTPVPGTGPIPMPYRWQHYLDKFKEQQQ